MRHFVGDGQGQFFAGTGEGNEAQVDGKDVTPHGIGVYRSAAVDEDEGFFRYQLAVGLRYLPDDAVDIGIDLAVMNIIVAVDGAEKAFGALVPDLLVFFSGRPCL